MALLEAKGISKKFEDLEIFSSLDLTVQENESLAIVGASGEGKSTLLHILGTLEPPTTGEIFIAGEKVSLANAAYLRSRKIGFVFQHFHLLEDYSVLENVLMPARIAGLPACTEHGLLLLKSVGLEQRAHFAAKQLSGGEKQRAAIARALCNAPPLILADEPSGNLDHKNAALIHDLLLSLTTDKSLVVVTHNIDFAARCSRTKRLSSGKIRDHE